MEKASQYPEPKPKFRVLEESKKLVFAIYSVCRQLPKDEKYILIQQMCRSALSVGSNIAEGQERKSKDNLNFIRIARGSLYELKLQLEIASDLYNIDVTEIYEIIDNIGKMTYGLIRKLKSETD